MNKEQLEMKKNIAALKAKGSKLWDPEEEKPENTGKKSKKPKNSLKYQSLWPPKPVAMKPADPAKTK